MKMDKTTALLVTAVTVLAIFSIGSGSAFAAKTDEWNAIVAAGDAASSPRTYRNYHIYNALTSADPSDNPLIIDLRPPEQYAAGHIPTAVNIQFTSLADSATLVQIDNLLAAHMAAGGKNQLFLYADQQTEGNIARTITTMLGYSSKGLRWGMATYSKNDIAILERFEACDTFDPVTGEGIAPAGCDENDYPIDTTYHPRVGGEGYPTVDNVPAGTPSREIIQVAADNWLSSLNSKSDYRMTMRELHALIDDNQDGVINGPGDDPSNDPFVLSNREQPWSPGCINCYEAGHIPGAYPTPRRTPTEVNVMDNLDYLPQDKLIAHHCWTGHSQQLLVPVAGMLGYNIKSLDNGITAWTIGGQPVVPRWRPGSEYTRDYPLDAIADVKISPQTLNTKSKGDYVTVQIRLPAGYDNTIINTATIRLEGTLSVAKVGTVDEDVVTVKFDRASVIGLPGVIPGSSSTLTVTGTSTDGKLNFAGSDTIKAL